VLYHVFWQAFKNELDLDSTLKSLPSGRTEKINNHDMCIAKKIQKRDKIECYAMEKKKKIILAKVKFILRGALISQNFCTQSLVPAYCAHYVFESGPWLEFFSDCF
jgi:hypothetical protein